MHARPSLERREMSAPLISSIRESTREQLGDSESVSAPTEDETPAAAAAAAEGPPRTGSMISMGRVRRVDSEIADNLQVFGRAYASKLSFWKSFVFAGLLGTLMGFLSLAFFW